MSKFVAIVTKNFVNSVLSILHVVDVPTLAVGLGGRYSLIRSTYLRLLILGDKGQQPEKSLVWKHCSN